MNVLVYAYNSDSPHHAEARRWWEDTLNRARPVGLAWATAIGFIRLATHRQIFERPMRVGDAIKVVRSWIQHPAVQIVTPGDRHADILFELLNSLGTGGNLTSDAHLAALAIEYHGEIASTDRDFGRFEGLRWSNPLLARH